MPLCKLRPKLIVLDLLKKNLNLPIAEMSILKNEMLYNFFGQICRTTVISERKLKCFQELLCSPVSK